MPINTDALKNSVQDKSPELPDLKQRPQHPSSQQPKANRAPADLPSQLFQSQTQAQRAAEQTQVALVTSHQQRLVELSGALDKAEQRRGEVLDRLSDRMAYLQDENLFMHDLLQLTQKKLKGTATEEQQATTGTAIDALVEAFDAIGNWELPAIAPYSVAGALPM